MLTLFFHLDDLMGRIVHDSRNLLAPIKGYASLLREGSRSEQGGHRWSQKILHSAMALDDFLSSLNLYRLRGSSQLEESTFAEILDEACTALEPVLGQQISLCVEGEIPGRYHLHRELLKRVMAQLLRNAWESSPRRSEITVCCSLQEPSPDLQGQRRALVKVIDRGCGIPRQRLPHVWRPFYTTKPRNLGLGLSYAAAAALLLQAKIGMQSAPNVGTTVVMAINLKEAPID